MTDGGRIISKTKIGRFTIIEKISETPMTQAQYDSAMNTLADLIVKAYMADHPELFKKPTESQELAENSGEIRHDPEELGLL
jgi:hypothetical protein